MYIKVFYKINFSSIGSTPKDTHIQLYVKIGLFLKTALSNINQLGAIQE